ncbi:hypothetical protein CU098_008459 [Rhizopus stolonifer]|uniref:Major facilitator superfamily (MFS) profile domain-containing protein n=1 Tax=Rhizopus stolonifer TaxID=4846 RepID=A0A367JUY4_RHIST|nr:hypothetical protein CU098_008459 [Rhizopus stolonifer]
MQDQSKENTIEDNQPTSICSTVAQPESKSRFDFMQHWHKTVIGDIYKDDDPRQYSIKKKAMITLIVGVSGVSGPLGTMIYLPGLSQISSELHASLPETDATVAVYLALLGIAPLFWASMSDLYGRKPMYIYSLVIGIVASILCAISHNIPTLLVFRAIQACGSSSGQTLGAGVIADTFDVSERGKAYSIFYLGPLLAPVLSSVVGGILSQFLGWKSTFYFLAILGGVLLFLVTFFLPETLRKKREEEKTISSDSEQLSLKEKSEHFKVLKNIKKAFIPMLLMLRDPTVLMITIYNTVIFASLYFLNPTITDTFENAYHYSSLQIGLCYLALGVGLIVGSISSGRYSDYVLKKLKEKNGPDGVYPELRIQAAYPSFALIPAGYLIYAWTTQYHVAVYAPLIGLFIYAVGQMTASTPTSVYLVDSKPGRSASAIAINNCVRCVIAAITTIFSSSSVKAIGPGILFTILAGINMLNIITVLLVRFQGRKWRTRFEMKIKATGQAKGDEETGLSPLTAVNSRMSAV